MGRTGCIRQAVTGHICDAVTFGDESQVVGGAVTGGGGGHQIRGAESGQVGGIAGPRRQEREIDRVDPGYGLAKGGVEQGDGRVVGRDRAGHRQQGGRDCVCQIGVADGRVDGGVKGVAGGIGYAVAGRRRSLQGSHRPDGAVVDRQAPGVKRGVATPPP